MITVLLKALARPFYKEHIGFFFVLLFFAGGFMRGTEHIAIAKYIAKSDALTLLILFLFTLFQIKVWLFLRAHIQKEHNRFLRNLTLMARTRQFTALLPAYASITIVVNIYGAFIGFFMWQSHEVYRLVSVFFYLVASMLVVISLIMRQLRITVREPKTFALFQFSNKWFSKPFMLWYSIYLFKNRPILYALSKLLSLSLLLSTFAFYDPQLYDWRFLGVGMVLSVSANLMLIQKYFDFQITELSYFNSFPTSILGRISGYIITLFFLMLPEIILIIRKLPEDMAFIFYVQAIFYSVLVGLFYFHWALLKNTNSEQLGKVCFYFTLLQIYMVLFGLPLYLSCLLVIVFVLVVQQQYYQLQR